MILIKNGHVKTMAGPDLIGGDVLIEDGKIKAVGMNLEAPADAQVIDAEGKLVVPGFVDAHCHIGLDNEGMGWEGHDYNEMGDILSPQLRGIDGFNPMERGVRMALEGGVTCVGTGPGSANVLGGTFIALKPVGDRVEKMSIKAEAAMKCAFGENPKNLYQNKFITSRMTTAAKLRDTLAKAKEYMEKLDAAEKDSSCKKPDFNFKLHALLPVMRREIPLKAHAHQANDLFTAIRIAKEFNVKLTLEHCTEGHLIADHLAKEGFPLAVGPSLTHSGKPEMRKKSYATPGILHRAGCQVSIITDSNVIPQEHLALCAGLAVKAGMEF